MHSCVGRTTANSCRTYESCAWSRRHVLGCAKNSAACGMQPNTFAGPPLARHCTGRRPATWLPRVEDMFPPWPGHSRQKRMQGVHGRISIRGGALGEGGRKCTTSTCTPIPFKDPGRCVFEGGVAPQHQQTYRQSFQLRGTKSAKLVECDLALGGSIDVEPTSSRHSVDIGRHSPAFRRHLVDIRRRFHAVVSLLSGI